VLLLILIQLNQFKGTIVQKIDIYKKISGSIKSNIIVLEKLLEKIHKEQRSIERQDLESLELFTKEKSLALAETQTEFNQRIDLFQALKIPKNEKGFLSFIKQLSGPQENRIKEEWGKLNRLMNETQEATLLNQKIIHKSKENNAKIIDILKGKRPDDNLYSNKGERKNIPYQTSLIKA